MRNSLFFLLTLLISVVYTSAWAQSGCTDSQATNYDATATTNDGSCTYPATSYNLSIVSTLPFMLNENSGMVAVDGKLWTHEDSGGDHAIYQIDPETGKIQKSVTLQDAPNIAWEDIASDGTHIYVGDFGNNDGSRTDLAIYKVNKNDIGSDSSSSVPSEAIYFSFEDQTDFTPQNFNTPYDCGAFFHANDSLHLFTHDWVNKATAHYVIPDQPGTHIAKLKETLNVGVQVAGADINPSGTEAILVGFNLSLTDLNVYMWVLSDFKDGHFFSGNKRKIKLGSFTQRGQIESVAYTEDHKGYMSSEFLRENFPPINIDANVYTFSTEAWVAVPTNISNQKEEAVNLFPNPASNEVFIQVKNPASYEVFNLIGQKMISGNLTPNNRTRLDVQQMKRGMYILRVNEDGRNHTVRLVLK